MSDSTVKLKKTFIYFREKIFYSLLQKIYFFSLGGFMFHLFFCIALNFLFPSQPKQRGGKELPDLKFYSIKVFH